MLPALGPALLAALPPTHPRDGEVWDPDEGARRAQRSSKMRAANLVINTL